MLITQFKNDLSLQKIKHIDFRIPSCCFAAISSMLREVRSEKIEKPSS